MFSLLKSIFCIIVLCFLIQACGDDAPILELNKRDLAVVDSLYNLEKEQLIIYTDSICDLKYPSYYSTAVDSIKKVRLKEIQFILGK